MTLTDRYINAAVAGVPDPARKDVADELTASVADAVDALVAGGLTRQDAEVKALTELGDPAVLAERFGGRPRHLIGPDHYREYTQLLKTLLAVVLPIVAIGSLLAQALAGAPAIDGLLSTGGILFQVGVQIAFWVTVVFAVLERTGTPTSGKQWTPADLPEPVNRRIGLGETVPAVVGLTLLIWLMLSQRYLWQVTSDGAEVPVLNPDAWMPWLTLVVGVLLAQIVLEVVKYRIGHWTVALAAVTTVLNLAFAGIVIGLWNAGTLLSPGVGGLWTWLGWLPWVVGLIAILDTADAWWKLRRG